MGKWGKTESQLIVACRKSAVGKGAQLVKMPGHRMERKVSILVLHCISVYSGPRTPIKHLKICKGENCSSPLLLQSPKEFMLNIFLPSQIGT